MRILMGSRAIRWHFPEFPREPKDRDYASDEQTSYELNGEKYEIYKIPALMKRFSPFTRNVKILSPDQIYTLKVSHSFWNINWEKTVFDIVWLRNHGAKLDRELFDELYAYWNEVHGENKRAELDQTKEMFFNDDIIKYEGIEHDDLHKFIQDPPTFTKILIDPDGVDVDEDKYNELSDEDKLNLVREECYVMSYERLAGRDPIVAYRWMVKHFILKHAPFYLALFAVQNFDKVRVPLINYKEKLDYDISANNSKA